MIMRPATLTTAFIGIALTAAGAAAQPAKTRPQFGGAIEYRAQIGSIPDSLDRRTGLALRVVADGNWKPYLGWRFEGAFVQAHYDRTTSTGTFAVNEDGYELAGFLRTTRPNTPTTKWVPYAVGGPILSLRGACSLDNGFGSSSEIRCADATTVRLGWAAGGGIRMRSGLGGWDWFVESRIVGGVTSVNGGKLFAIAFGAGI